MASLVYRIMSAIDGRKDVIRTNETELAKLPITVNCCHECYSIETTQRVHTTIKANHTMHLAVHSWHRASRNALLNIAWS